MLLYPSRADIFRLMVFFSFCQRAKIRRKAAAFWLSVAPADVLKDIFSFLTSQDIFLRLILVCSAFRLLVDKQHGILCACIGNVLPLKLKPCGRQRMIDRLLLSRSLTASMQIYDNELVRGLLKNVSCVLFASRCLMFNALF